MIGVVGGVGPYAGIDLIKNIFDQTNAGTDQQHMDVVMFSLSSTILDRTEYLLEKVDKNPGVAIAKVLIRLEKAGASVAGIPCNTAHAAKIFNAMQAYLSAAKSKIQVLSLIDEAINTVRGRFPKLSQIGVLATTGTNQFGIYTDALITKGLTPVLIERKMQEEVIHPAIYDPGYGIKAVSNPVTPRARQDLIKGIDMLKSRGAELVIKGCTEIALAIPENEMKGITLIDPSISLARALIKRIDPAKLKPLHL
jgi:aspartate racemase